MDVTAGEVDRVEGALTAIESVVEVVVDSEVVDPVPVRKTEAASRGRPATDVVVALTDVLLRAPFGLALLLLILAASWLSDGRRPPIDLLGCGASRRPAAGCGGFVVAIVMVGNKRCHCAL